MHLNTLAPAPGAKKARTRVGRGISAGKGKTCGRGVKGQHARSGGLRKVFFEGGQMPLQRRLPKFGFKSRADQPHEVRLYQLVSLEGDVIELATLKDSGIIPQNASSVRIVNAGTVSKAYKVRGVYVTKGAKEVITQAGGSIE
jgi:large subunit ribosomal protein L15